MQARKSLGQHFLTSRAIARSIVRAGNITEDDIVLEIGPGKGILTKALLEKAGRVIAIEKDKRLIGTLQEKFAKEIKNKKLKLVCDDILQFNPSSYNLKPKTYKLVANIPYYITGDILKTFLSSDTQPSHIVILVQKEVAKRIAVSPRARSRSKPFDKTQGKESILSISVKVYGTPKYIQTVPSRYFKPQPKVNSAILAIENISKDFFDTISEKDFFALVKAGFQHKRKFLIKNLEHFFDAQDSQKIFLQCTIPPKARAENISLDQWKCLSKTLQ